MSKKMFEILKGGESVSKLLYHQIAKNVQNGERESKFTEMQKYTSITYAGGRAARPGGYS